MKDPVFTAKHELRAARIRDAVVNSDIAYNDLRRFLEQFVSEKDKAGILARVDTYLEAKIEEINTRSTL